MNIYLTVLCQKTLNVRKPTMIAISEVYISTYKNLSHVSKRYSRNVRKVRMLFMIFGRVKCTTLLLVVEIRRILKRKTENSTLDRGGDSFWTAISLGLLFDVTGIFSKNLFREKM